MHLVSKHTISRYGVPTCDQLYKILYNKTISFVGNSSDLFTLCLGRWYCWSNNTEAGTRFDNIWFLVQKIFFSINKANM